MEELTPEQKARFPEFLDRWMAIGLSTQPAARPTAERGVRLAYEAAGLAPPQQFYWAGSPLAGALIDTVIGKLAEEKKTAPSKTKTDYPPRVLAVVDSVMPILGEICGKKAPKRNFVISCLSDLQLHNAAYGQHDASILCFYDFFAQVCGVEECRKLEGLNLVAQSCGWWWAYDTSAILTERPQRLSLDDRGRLHADSDWAILYPDGFGYCLVHGVEVPEHVVLAPEKITVTEIEAEQNVEVRRVMIEKYGQARYLLDSGATEIHRDDWGILYRKDFKPNPLSWRNQTASDAEPDDEPIVMVKVVNSTPEPDGSFRDYFIRVAPDLHPMTTPPGEPQELSALNAVASTFGMTGEEYAKLEVQT